MVYGSVRIVEPFVCLMAPNISSDLGSRVVAAAPDD